jgi:hypothetical protein
LPRGTLYRLMKSHALDGASFRRQPGGDPPEADRAV